MAHDERRELSSALRTESAVLHRVVSQRADQHDAHLTSLAALASSGAAELEALFLEVGGAIRTFYPRVVAIDLVPLVAGDDPVLTTRARAAATTTPGNARRALARSDGGPVVIGASRSHPGHYRLTKRVPSDPAVDARFALVLEIDARRLLETDTGFWRLADTDMGLKMPDGDALLGVGPSLRPDTGALQALMVEATLGSRTQPLRLVTSLRLRPRDLLPLDRIVRGLAALGLIALAAWQARRLLVRTRAAELRARVGEQDAKLSQASRINALGEMASGIAHELTQPLTAVLSQSQAGLRLLAREPDAGHEPLREVFEANVLQAKRAAGILARLRTWTRRSSERREPVDVTAAMDNVMLLLEAEAKRLRIELAVGPVESTLSVLGDPVALEQVLFNLVRNAMDALRGTGPYRTIRIAGTARDAWIEITVTDTGPGIDPSMRGRLFEPFASGREDGMGLGLALCERIVERMDGTIEIADGVDGGTAARVRLPRLVIAAP